MRRALSLIVIFFGLHAAVTGVLSGGLLVLYAFREQGSSWYSMLVYFDILLEYLLALFFEHPDSGVPEFFSGSFSLAISNSFCFAVLLYLVLRVAAKIAGRSSLLYRYVFKKNTSRASVAEGLRSGLPYLSLAEDYIRRTKKHRVELVFYVAVVHMFMSWAGNAIQTGLIVGKHTGDPYVATNSFLTFHRFPLVPLVMSDESWSELHAGRLLVVNSIAFALLVFVFLEVLRRWVAKEGK